MTRSEFAIGGFMRTLVIISLLGVAFVVCSFAQNERDVTVNVAITGADSVPEAVRGTILRNLKEVVTQMGQLKEELAARLHDQFQQAGYFKAEIGDPKWGRIDRTTSVPTIEVEFPVRPGPLVRLKSVEIKGNTVFSADALRPMVPMEDGDIVNVELLRKGIENLRDAYCTKGYVDLIPVPDVAFHDDSRMTLTFDLKEGAQYRVGKLVLNGVEPFPGAGKQLMNAWKNVEGKVYTCDVWKSVLQTKPDGSPAEVAALRKLFSDSAKGGEYPEITENKDLHVIDVRVNFPDPQ